MIFLPVALICKGNISEANNQHIGPIPIENQNTKANMPHNQKVSVRKLYIFLFPPRFSTLFQTWF